MYWLVLLDDYSAGFGLMVVVIATCLVVTRVYGTGSVPRGARRAVCQPAAGTRLWGRAEPLSLSIPQA